MGIRNFDISDLPFVSGFQLLYFSLKPLLNLDHRVCTSRASEPCLLCLLEHVLLLEYLPEQLLREHILHLLPELLIVEHLLRHLVRHETHHSVLHLSRLDLVGQESARLLQMREAVDFLAWFDVLLNYELQIVMQHQLHVFHIV